MIILVNLIPINILQIYTIKCKDGNIITIEQIELVRSRKKNALTSPTDHNEMSALKNNELKNKALEFNQ